MRPILDNFAWFVIGAGCGAAAMFLFALKGWNPLFLAGCWTVTAISWTLGRIVERQRRSSGHDSVEGNTWAGRP